MLRSSLVIYGEKADTFFQVYKMEIHLDLGNISLEFCF